MKIILFKVNLHTQVMQLQVRFLLHVITQLDTEIGLDQEVGRNAKQREEAIDNRVSCAFG